MECRDGLRVFETIGAAFNAPIDTNQLLRLLAATIADRFRVDGCAIWLLSRDRRTLDDVASVGLSDKFLGKGPIDSARSVKDALDGEIVSITDCPNDPRIQYRAAFAEEGIVSLLALPLASRGQVIGVVRLYSKQRREFTDEEKHILSVAASFCAYALAHSMFQQIIHDISDSVRTSLVLDEVLQQIVKVISEDLRVKGSLIRLFDAETGKLELRASFGLSQAYLDAGARFPERALEEIREGRPVAVFDAVGYLGNPEPLRREGVASLLSVPLKIHGQSIGVLRLYTHKPYTFSENEINLMSLVGEHCALLIRNAQLYSAMKVRYESLVTDFHAWFDRFCGPGALKI